MAALCLFFSAQAQSQKSVKPIQVGQRMTELILNKIHNYKTTRCNLADIGFKFMIIQFWSTGYAECTADFQRIEELQCLYRNDLQFLKVTTDTEADVLSFLLTHPLAASSCIPFVTDDKVLSRLFPHNQSPQYVWMDGTGKIVAITTAKAVTEENIDLAFNHNPISISTPAAMPANVQ